MVIILFQDEDSALSPDELEVDFTNFIFLPA